MMVKAPPHSGHCSIYDLEYPFDQPAPAQAPRRHGRGHLGVVG